MATLLLPDGRAWTRVRRGSVLVGACAALARALGLPVRAVRMVFVLGSAVAIPAVPLLGAWQSHGLIGGLALAIGSPFVLGYLALWWALPFDREAERLTELSASSAAVHGRPAASASHDAAATEGRQLTRWLALAAIIGMALVIGVAALAVPFGGALLGRSDVIGSTGGGYAGLAIAASGIVAAGIALGVLPLEAVDRARWGGRLGAMPRPVVVALGTALTLFVVGALWLVGILFGGTAALVTATIVLAVLALLAVVVIPWGRRLWIGMREEAEERVLVQQRSEFTAHLHDSVLQTLTILQKPGTDPEEARLLARRQERELRRWLYRDASGDPDGQVDVRDAVTSLCEAAEDAHGVDVHVVVIGTAELTEPMRPLLGALREATLNACRHGRVGVDVFVDVSPARIEAYVRDRGPGFDLADIPEDRLGVRQSIIGRMTGAGGTAHVRRAPGGGTEVALILEPTPRSIR